MPKNIPVQPKTTLWHKAILIICGIFCCVILLEIGLRIGGLVILSLQEYRNRISLGQKGTYRIMCLGESTTAGGQEAYPAQLEEALNQRNIGLRFSVINKGVNAVNTPYILAHLEENLNKYKPDMVITMMGMNDAGIHMPNGIVSHSKIILLLSSFRTYKLARLLWLHIVTTAKERGICHPKTNKPQFTPQSGGIEGKNIVSAEASLKKDIAFNPKNGSAYEGLGWLYVDQRNIIEAEQAFKKALELNPNSSYAYEGLGQLYVDHNKLIEAEQAFKKALELNPNSYYAYEGLGRIYENQGKLGEAEQMLKKILELNPKKNDRVYGGLATIYGEMGDNKLSEIYAEKADNLRGYRYNPMTVNNYRALKRILDQKGIKLVCVQYPMRSIEPLKRIFEGQHGITFVDNEKVFKEAVKKEGYKIYFRDMFGGDFGHCTEKGNRLLAENIAGAILQACSKQ